MSKIPECYEHERGIRRINELHFLKSSLLIRHITNKGTKYKAAKMADENACARFSEAEVPQKGSRQGWHAPTTAPGRRPRGSRSLSTEVMAPVQPVQSGLSAALAI